MPLARWTGVRSWHLGRHSLVSAEACELLAEASRWRRRPTWSSRHWCKIRAGGSIHRRYPRHRSCARLRASKPLPLGQRRGEAQGASCERRSRRAQNGALGSDGMGGKVLSHGRLSAGTTFFTNPMSETKPTHQVPNAPRSTNSETQSSSSVSTAFQLQQPTVRGSTAAFHRRIRAAAGRWHDRCGWWL